jgi:outer membrane protein OmpA-like peptidoglycan-associated protein
MMSRQSQAMVNQAHAVQPAKPSHSAPTRQSATNHKMGNQAAQRLLREGVVQAKLTVNQPGDRFEQEADRVAEAVMCMPDPSNAENVGSFGSGSIPAVQRICSECEEELNQSSSGIQRMCSRHGEESNSDDDDEERNIQAKEVPGRTPEVTPTVQAQIERARDGGQPLAESARAFFEPRFGRDFSNVRVHTDAQAAESAQQMQALAYTMGRDIVFGKGQYAPETTEGRWLLAHELVHTVQQGQADHSVSIQRACGAPDIAATVGTRAGCTDNFDGTFVSGSLFKFNKDCDDFAPAQQAALISFAGGLPATATLEIHGFASVDGPSDFNQNLGCARASKAQSVLTSPSPGGAGIAPSRITGVINHGPVPGPVADRRSVVIRTTTTPSPPPPPPTPLTVAFTHIQALTSPAGMPDRIPPRVDTIVGVGIAGFLFPMLPITLSIEGAGGGNGTATIDGAATVDLTASAAVRLRGVDQTDVGKAGNLKLVADQGGTRLAASNNFSVSTIPQNHTIAFNCLIPDPGCPSSVLPGDVRGFKVTHTWESDSNVTSDLDKTDISEEVEVESSGGSLTGSGITSGYLGEGTLSLVDEHGTPAMSSTGFRVTKQTQKFKDNRTGAVDIPVTNSGYRIGRFILPKPGTGFLGFFQDFEITTSKFGFATTANGVSSGAGSGSVTRTQDI